MVARATEYPKITPRDIVRPKKSAPTPDILAHAPDAGNIEVVKIDDLHRDPSYQRPVNQEIVDQIASNYDIVAAGAIVVSRRKNGDLYIVDGQHRSGGATQAGETEILAHVINGLSQREEAILRLKGNKRRPDRPQERFAAQCSAGDPESLHIKEIVHSLGGHVNTHPDSKNGLNAISALEWIYRRDGGVLLVRTLEFLKDTFGNLDGPHASVALMKGVAWYLTANADDQPSRPRMVERMATMGVTQIMQRARNHKAVMGKPMWANVYRTMIDFYNERLNESRKLEVRLGGSARPFGREGYGDE